METSNDNLIQNLTLNDLFINHEALEQAINSIKSSTTPNKIVIGGQPLRQPEVIIQAEHIIDYKFHGDQTEQDRYIKNELALKIAKQLVDEDLIQIQINDDPFTLNKKVRAKVKIIQE